MTGTQTTWTTERIALLKNRIDAGLSCGQIAREIGVSRNAVIGKANRLGLSLQERSRNKARADGDPEDCAPQDHHPAQEPPSVVGKAADCVWKGVGRQR